METGTRRTRLYSSLSNFFRKLVAPQPLPRSTIVFLLGSCSSWGCGCRSTYAR